MLMVGESKKEVVNEIMQMTRWYEKRGGHSIVEDQQDTLTYIVALDEDVQQGILVFDNDQCTYQVVELSCSPCLDSYLLSITTDHRYLMQQKGELTYIGSNTLQDIMIKVELVSNENLADSCKKIVAQTIPYVTSNEDRVTNPTNK